MNAEIQAILSRYDLPNNVLLGDLSGHLSGDELARVHYLLKYPNEQTEPKGGRVRMEEQRKTAFETMQSIVKDKQAKEIEGVLVDMFTASALVQAYEQVNDSNKRRIEASNLDKLVHISHMIMEASDE